MRDYRANLWKFYFASVLSGFAAFYNGVDTLYFRHFLLDFEQISFLISAALIATLLFEVPTGSFADMYGKKRSILAGSFVRLGGLGFLTFGSTFGAFVIGFVLLGIGRAFESGAGSALLYEFLASVDRQHEYIQHQSRIQAGFVGIDIISGSVGFRLFAINVRIPFIVSFASMVLVILVQLTLREIPVQRTRKGNLLRAHLRQIHEGISVTFKSRVVLWLTGFSLAFFIAGMFFGNVLNLPFLREAKRFSTTELAIMGLVWNTIQTATIIFIGRIERRLGQTLSLITIVVLTPALFLALLLSDHYLVSAVILGLYFSIVSFREVIVDSYLNTHIQSYHRATVLSVNSMLLSGLAIVVLPVLGNLLNTFGLRSMMLLLAMSTFLWGALSLAIKRYVLAEGP